MANLVRWYSMSIVLEPIHAFVLHALLDATTPMAPDHMYE
jgi:hypothetical protein